MWRERRGIGVGPSRSTAQPHSTAAQQLRIHPGTVRCLTGRTQVTVGPAAHNGRLRRFDPALRSSLARCCSCAVHASMPGCEARTAAGQPWLSPCPPSPPALSASSRRTSTTLSTTAATVAVTVTIGRSGCSLAPPGAAAVTLSASTYTALLCSATPPSSLYTSAHSLAPSLLPPPSSFSSSLSSLSSSALRRWGSGRAEVGRTRRWRWTTRPPPPSPQRPPPSLPPPP